MNSLSAAIFARTCRRCFLVDNYLGRASRGNEGISWQRSTHSMASGSDSWNTGWDDQKKDWGGERERRWQEEWSAKQKDWQGWGQTPQNDAQGITARGNGNGNLLDAVIRHGDGNGNWPNGNYKALFEVEDRQALSNDEIINYKPEKPQTWEMNSCCLKWLRFSHETEEHQPTVDILDLWDADPLSMKTLQREKGPKFWFTLPWQEWSWRTFLHQFVQSGNFQGHPDDSMLQKVIGSDGIRGIWLAWLPGSH